MQSKKALALLSVLLVPAIVVAQPSRQVQHIAVVEQDGQCLYRVVGQSNQDEFVIEPKGRVVFQFLRGLKATALIAEAPDGTQGTSGPNAVTVTQGGPRSLDVREAIGQDTEHQVQIQCCMERQGQRCDRWTDATAAAEDLDHRVDTPHGLDRSGPSAPMAEGPPPPEPKTGGPRMKVDE